MDVLGHELAHGLARLALAGQNLLADFVGIRAVLQQKLEGPIARIGRLFAGRERDVLEFGEGLLRMGGVASLGPDAALFGGELDALVLEAFFGFGHRGRKARQIWVFAQAFASLFAGLAQGFAQYLIGPRLLTGILHRFVGGEKTAELLAVFGVVIALTLLDRACELIHKVRAETLQAMFANHALELAALLGGELGHRRLGLLLGRLAH